MIPSDDPTFTGISVIIPNRNHGHRLEQCLEALRIQTFPSEKTQIIVVDNGSDDNSIEIVVKHGAQLLDLPGPKNQYVARNRGIEQARFSHIALLDSTCVPVAGYLEELQKVMLSSGAALVAGNIEFEFPDNPTTCQAVDALTFMRNREYLPSRKSFPGGTLFFPKGILDRIGMFREDLRSGSDGEWTGRFFRNKEIVAYAHRAVVKYPPRKCRQLWRKAFRIGRGHGALMKENDEFSFLKCLLEMRPPSPKFLDQMIHERGIPRLRQRRFRIWLFMWLYRGIYSSGKIAG